MQALGFKPQQITNTQKYSPDDPLGGITFAANYVPPVTADQVLGQDYVDDLSSHFRYAPLRTDLIHLSHLPKAQAISSGAQASGQPSREVMHTLIIDQIAQQRLHASHPREYRVTNTTRKEDSKYPFRKHW